MRKEVHTYYYACVNKKTPDLDNQLDDFRRLGAEERNIFADREQGQREIYRFLRHDMLKSGDTLVVGSLYCLGENTAEIIRNMEFFMYCNVRLDILDLPVTFSEGECLNGRPEKTYLLLYRSQSYSFGRKRNYPPFTQISR